MGIHEPSWVPYFSVGRAKPDVNSSRISAGAEEALYRGHQRRCDQHQPAGRAYDQHTRSRSDPGAPRSDAAIGCREAVGKGDFFIFFHRSVKNILEKKKVKKKTPKKHV